MSFIEHYKKRRALKSYAYDLPKILSKDYGKSDYYTPKQVTSSIDRTAMNTVYTYYALTMFCGRGDFDLFNNETYGDLDYEELRADIGDAFFDGKTDFTAKHIDQLDPEYFSSSAFSNTDVDGFADFGDGGGGDG